MSSDGTRRDTGPLDHRLRAHRNIRRMREQRLPKRAVQWSVYFPFEPIIAFMQSAKRADFDDFEQIPTASARAGGIARTATLFAMVGPEGLEPSTNGL